MIGRCYLDAVSQQLVRLLFWNRNSAEERVDMFDMQSSKARRRAGGGGIDNPAMRYDGSTCQIESTNGTSIETGTTSMTALGWCVCKGNRKSGEVGLVIYT